jgi:hypothetical protein
MDERVAKEGGRGAQRAREAQAAERQAAEAAAEEAEQDAAMQGMREKAEGAMAGTGASDSFDVLEPAAMRPVFAPATPHGGASASAAAPPRLADAVAGGASEARAVARLSRRLLSADAMDTDGEDDGDFEEGAAALALAAYPYCPGAGAADAAAAAALASSSSSSASSAAEAAGRGALRVLASPEAAEKTAVVLGAGVVLLARMGVRDPALAAASDAPALAGGGVSSSIGKMSLGGGGSNVDATWVPCAHDFVALFGALGYGGAFVEAAGANGSNGAGSSTTTSSSSSPTPRVSAALQVALRALRHALELRPAAVFSPRASSSAAGTSAEDDATAACWATPELCATALTCGLLRLRLDPSVRAAALPALDAALAAALKATPARAWPRVCGAAAALIGAPVAPSHRAALMLLQELPAGRTPRAAQLQAAGALALLRALAHCLRSGGDPSALGVAAAAAANGAQRSKRATGGADGPVSVWPTAKEVIDVLDAAGGARTLFAAVNATGAGGAGGGGGGGGGRGGGDGEEEDDDEAAAAAPAPATRTAAAAAYWAALTAIDAADMVLWAHVDGSLARARAAEDVASGSSGSGSGANKAAGAWTRSAGAAWAKWLDEAGKQVRRTIWLHALRARIGELEHTYELVAGGVAVRG